MSDFRTLPVEEAVTWIQAWTDHAWPITPQEALTIRNNLGWKPSPRDATFFFTKLSNNGKEDGIFFEDDILNLKGIHFNLSSIYSFDDDEYVNQLSDSAYSQYVNTLSQLWGAGKSSKDGGVSETRWKLPNKVSISVFGMNGLVSVDIDSPQRTKLKEEYDRAMEDYE